MKIKTKFNVGNKVWYISGRGFIKCSTIIYTQIEIFSEVIQFHYELDNEIGYYPEEDIFATEKEAQAECDRRNR